MTQSISKGYIGRPVLFFPHTSFWIDPARSGLGKASGSVFFLLFMFHVDFCRSKILTRNLSAERERERVFFSKPAVVGGVRDSRPSRNQDWKKPRRRLLVRLHFSIDDRVMAAKRTLATLAVTTVLQVLPIDSRPQNKRIKDQKSMFDLR